MRKVTGVILVVLGILAMGYGLFSTGAPPESETLNLGLLVEKIVFALIGSAFFSVGSLALLLPNAST